MITVETLPAFDDNYFWLLHRNGKAAVVDPGDADVVERALQAHRLQLSAILVTHHHGDHIGGIARLAAAHGAQVYGPRAEHARIPELQTLLDDGDEIDLPALDLRLRVYAVPGHTLGHIAYYAAAQAWLFCGDTLFLSGCGRLFEGSPEQMYHSLQRLSALPPDTLIYCAHEYTLSNLAFAAAVEPDNAEIRDERARVSALRAQGRPSVPGRLGEQHRYNPFLRCNVASVHAAAERYVGTPLAQDAAVFAALRRWKDNFRG